MNKIYLQNGMYVNCGSCGKSVLSVTEYSLPIEIKATGGKFESFNLCNDCAEPMVSILSELLSGVLTTKEVRTLSRQ